MDLNILQDKFKALFSATPFGKDVEYEMQPDLLSMVFHAQIGEFDDDVRVAINVYPNGGFLLDYIFDQFDLNVDTCEFINQYNQNVLFFKAFVNEGGFLEIAATNMESDNEDSVIHKVAFLMNSIVSDDNLEYLRPLTEITE